jgi:hypothetical protein
MATKLQKAIAERNAFWDWLDTFVAEKGVDRDHMIEVEGPNWGTNWIKVSHVLAAIKVAPTSEQKAIKTMLVKLDFANAPIVPYFAHLAKAIAL